MKTNEMMDKLRELAKTHELVNESTFSYFPEVKVIRPLFNAACRVLENYREEHDLSEDVEIELFVAYEEFRFSVGEIDAPYDQFYLYLKETENVEYKSFQEVFQHEKI